MAEGLDGINTIIKDVLAERAVTMRQLADILAENGYILEDSEIRKRAKRLAAKNIIDLAKIAKGSVEKKNTPTLRSVTGVKEKPVNFGSMAARNFGKKVLRLEDGRLIYRRKDPTQIRIVVKHNGQIRPANPGEIDAWRIKFNPQARVPNKANGAAGIAAKKPPKRNINRRRI